MSTGVRVTNERSPRRFAENESVEGVVDDEDVDWDPTNGGTVELDQWKQPVRVATTGDITIATALNAGDTLDGVTLAAGDRVLVKDQSTPEENGIWVVGATPVRAADMDDDDEVLGAAVYVIAGTTNGGTAWAVDLTTEPVIDTDPITWASFGGSSVTREWELWNEGGDPMLQAHGNFGATETIDPTDGNVHTGTLDADCTVTLSAPAGTAASLLLWLTQDSTGGRDITWSGSVSEIGTPDTTADYTNLAVATTSDGGSSWVVAWVGSGASAAADVTFDPTGLTYTDATDVQEAIADHDAAIGDLAATVAAIPIGHAHVVEETHLSDGSTVTWTLDQNYEPGSVIAWNITTIARLLVTEVPPDQATVSAAGATGDKIVFDYAATLA